MGSSELCMAEKLHEMGDVRLSQEFKRCYLQSTASFFVAAKSFSQEQTVLCHELGGKTEQPSSCWRLYLSFAAFSGRVVESLLCLDILCGFTLLVCLFLAFRYKGLFPVVVRNADIFFPHQQTVLSFWLKVSLLFLSCLPVLHCWVTLPQMPVSSLHCPRILLLRTLWGLVS